VAGWIARLFSQAQYAPKPEQAEHAGLSLCFAMRMDLGTPVWLEAGGTSMLPGWLPGCKVKLAPVETEPEIGMILVFRHGAKLYYHRVIERIGRNQWRTKGDALLHPDEPVSTGDIIGRVTAVRRWRHVREVRPDPAAARLSLRLGHFFDRFDRSAGQPMRLALRMAYLGALLGGWPFRHQLTCRDLRMKSAAATINVMKKD
jgi:hypothetical protein